MPMIGPSGCRGDYQRNIDDLCNLGWMTKTDGNYLTLYAAADALLYFMPIIVGFRLVRYLNVILM